ncbi:MAG: tetratricopeptide repeat protein [Oscillospiraceae bacterium]|nr:tetratricopeptide repeat protein [Oscillospiraceae bacterium]
MLERLIFIIIAFLLFIYIFLYKMIKKNDTTYLWIISMQAIGILINLIQIVFGVLTGIVFIAICYILCVIIPILIILIEAKGIHFAELTYLAMAKTYTLTGNNKKAKEFLIKCVTINDKSYYGHKMLAEIYEKEGGMRKAIDEYVKVLEIRKNDHQTYFTISILLRDLGRKDESIHMLKTLTKKKPELYKATEMLGDLYIEQEKFSEALSLYTKALRIHPNKYEIYYNLGIVHSRMNEFDLAKECYEKAAEINHDFANSHFRLGQLSLLYRDIDGAEDNFLNGLNGETEAQASFELAKIYVIKNNPEKAKMFANKAVDMDQKYYNIIQEESLLTAVKHDVVPPKEDMAPKEHVLSHKEEMVNEYLKDTYNLTKKINLKEAEAEGININEFKWEKGKENKQRYEKQRVDPN